VLRSVGHRACLAPEYVLRYLVAHEAAHLVIPDHSHRFWLTVHSVCLSENEPVSGLRRMAIDLPIDVAALVE
jgi:predicted metal-dependent hydrolase